MTKHEFLALLAESHEFYGQWTDDRTLYASLRLNTPRGQARWDQQARSLMPRLLKRGLIERVPCPETGKRTPQRSCGKQHTALTALGRAQLEAWNKLGCDAHTHVGNCHAPESEFKFDKVG
ncbi:MAG TPA: hypothetical protein VMU16_05555 [Candidatus Binataceae bacterium]|nr:hypothetical protein [Candidatus Binataceae bacterium]